jgi:N-methylhydantoinase A/oxoprolinase/acetone carboxylase beta subunit
MLAIGVNIGGTFSHVVEVTAEGQLDVAKVSSTAGALVEGSDTASRSCCTRHRARWTESNVPPMALP